MDVPSLRIRAFEAADRGPLIALWEACDLLTNPLNDPTQDIDFCIESGHGTVLVGCDAETGALLASCMVGHDGHRAWIYYLAADPAYRRAGIGRRMTRAAERWARARGVAKIELIVRDGNRQVIGFYQRLGYVPEPRQILSRRLDGQGAPMGGQDARDAVVVTYLEMTERPALPDLRLSGRKHSLLRLEQPTVGFYRYLYDAVGRAWHWTDRKVLSDDELAAAIQDERVEIGVLYVDGQPAGYFELDRRRPPDIELAYFGIIEGFIGQGLGPYLLVQAIEAAWAHEPDRLHVNTCTLDHPSALGLYQRFGFRPYKRLTGLSDWQRAEAEQEP